MVVKCPLCGEPYALKGARTVLRAESEALIGCRFTDPYLLLQRMRFL
jgi:hypothetical protein